MRLSGGKDAAARVRGVMRKKVILDFIANSQEHEVKIFLDLIFEPFLHFCSGKSEHDGNPLRLYLQHVLTMRID